MLSLRLSSKYIHQHGMFFWFSRLQNDKSPSRCLSCLCFSNEDIDCRVAGTFFLSCSVINGFDISTLYSRKYSGGSDVCLFFCLKSYVQRGHDLLSPLCRQNSMRVALCLCQLFLAQIRYIWPCRRRLLLRVFFSKFFSRILTLCFFPLSPKRRRWNTMFVLASSGWIWAYITSRCLRLLFFSLLSPTLISRLSA